MTKNKDVDLRSLYQRYEKKEIKHIQGDHPDRILKLVQDYEEFLQEILQGTRDSVMVGSDLQSCAMYSAGAYEIFTVLEVPNPMIQIVKAARYAVGCVCVRETRAENGEDAAMSLSMVAEFFGYIAVADRRKDMGLFFEVLVAGLQTSLLEFFRNPLRVGQYTDPQFSFLLLLASAFFKQPIERAGLGFTSPEWMPAYTEALAEWRSTDLGRIRAIIDAMADFHVQNTTRSLSSFVRAPYENQEIFPYEILTFLRFREWAGLENPTDFDHPLMHSPVAVLPKAPLPNPDMPLLISSLERFRTEYPEPDYCGRLLSLW